MIQKKEQMQFNNEHLITIISGLPGVGKTTLAMSAPNAILIDFDKGVKRTKPEHRTDIITVSDYESLLEDMKSSELDNYETIIFDTCGQFIELLKDWAARNGYAKKDGTVSLQGFGAVKQEFLRFSAEMKKRFNVVYLFHTIKDKDVDGNPVYELMCEGATKQTVWIPADLGAYLEIIGNDRYLNFTPSQNYSSKACYGINGKFKIPELTENTPNNFLSILFTQVKEYLQKENIEFSEKSKEYETIMAEIRDIINNINNIENVNKAINDIKQIKPVLTSEKEAKALLSAKLKELNIVWNKDKKVYEQK